MAQSNLKTHIASSEENQTIRSGSEIKPKPTVYAVPNQVPQSLEEIDFGQPTGGVVKRVLDIVLALAVIVAIAPLLVTLTILVKLTSKGPALFAQDRGGREGLPFRVLKFRTMTVTENGDVIAQAKREDPRITRIGAFLRKTGLDELPQLYNVLRGDMSLVGPRPHALAHDARFAKHCAAYPERFRARPGITGLAQISGSRGPINGPEDLEKRVDFDLAYIRQWSFWKDVAIMMKTARLLLGDKNAF